MSITNILHDTLHQSKNKHELTDNTTSCAGGENCSGTGLDTMRRWSCRHGCALYDVFETDNIVGRAVPGCEMPAQSVRAHTHQQAAVLRPVYEFTKGVGK